MFETLLCVLTDSYPVAEFRGHRNLLVGLFDFTGVALARSVYFFEDISFFPLDHNQLRFLFLLLKTKTFKFNFSPGTTMTLTMTMTAMTRMTMTNFILLTETC